MDALSKLRQRNRHFTTLRTGLAVSWHLPDSERCLAEVLSIEASQPWRIWEAKQRMVAEMLDSVEGEEILPRDDRRAIVAALTPDERRELYDLALPDTVTPEAAAGPSPDEAATVEEGWARAAEENRRIWLEGSRAAVAR